MNVWRTRGVPVFAVLLLLVAVLGPAGCQAPGRDAGGSVPHDPEVAPGETGVFTEGDREVRLRVPRSYDPGSPAPFVVALHGYGGDAEKVLDMPGFLAAVDDEGFLLAVPEGTTDQHGRQFWDATDACCDFHGQGVDDSQHVARVIEAVAENYSVDPGRVFVLGLSNGGFMAHRLACDHAELVAAIVSVAGAQDYNSAACDPARPVSVLQVHGTADQVVPFHGGVMVPGGPPVPSAKDTVAQWRALDGCSPGPVAAAPLDATSSLPGAETARIAWHDGCDTGTEVELWKVSGGGHVDYMTPGFTATVLHWLSVHARSGG
jgi:polyhydroxybutyrate depolymerase